MAGMALALWSKMTGWVRPRGEAGAVRRDVLRLALPATMEQTLGMTVGIVDTFLVGHLGAESLAAVGLAYQWIFLATTLFGAIAVGSTALIAAWNTLTCWP